MNKYIRFVLFSVLLFSSSANVALAVGGDHLNTKQSYGERISRGFGNLFTSRADSNYLNAKPPYTERVSEKLGRGVTNFFLGPYEIKKSYMEEYEKNNLLASACTTGLLKGAFRSAKRMVVGFYEFFTSPIPQDPIILPEYVTDRSL